MCFEKMSLRILMESKALEKSEDVADSGGDGGWQVGWTKQVVDLDDFLD